MKLNSLPDNLDMEIVAGTFFETQSAVSREYGAPDFHVYIFDVFGTAKYHSRYSYLQDLRLPAWATIVTQKVVNDQHELDAFYHACLSAGSEGIMIRWPNARYKEGRASLAGAQLIKRKPLFSAEARCTGVTEQMQNTNEQTVNELGHLVRSSHKAGKVGKGMAGALILEHEKFGEFKVAGFTDETARTFWDEPPLGKLIEFEYRDVTNHGKPRFPIYKAIRAEFTL
jgi:DNA ligase-1